MRFLDLMCRKHCPLLKKRIEVSMGVVRKNGHRGRFEQVHSRRVSDHAFNGSVDARHIFYTEIYHFVLNIN